MFFEVSSITTKRFFINREDITGPHYTNYVTRAFCNDRPSPLVEDQYGNSPLLELLKNGYAFFDLPPDPSTSKPYILIGKECGDCSRVCNPVAPDFWID